MRCSILILATYAAVSAIGIQAQGGEHYGHREAICPKCKACCTLNVKCDKEKKECFEVKCEQICVPRVVFPWQSSKGHGAGRCPCKGGCLKCSCVNRGAWVKTVKKLTTESCECPVCKYEWTPACCCCRGPDGVHGAKKSVPSLTRNLDREQAPAATRRPPAPQPIGR
jgi:hypothetical protein